VIGKQKIWVGIVAAGLSLGCAAPGMAQNGPGVPLSPAATAPANTSSTTGLGQEALGWLAELLKINTTNPPGNEEVAAKYIAGILQKEGIAADILPLTPGRSAVVARLKSAAIADPSRALLLVAHMDVVGVDKSKWTADPFAND